MDIAPPPGYSSKLNKHFIVGTLLFVFLSVCAFIFFGFSFTDRNNIFLLVAFSMLVCPLFGAIYQGLVFLFQKGKRGNSEKPIEH
jgi:hypothetical protein